MATPRSLDDLLTPAAVIDLDRMTANLDRMAAYTRESGFALRPHTKTHKTPELAQMQISRGAVGVTVATLREAEVMSAVADDVLIAYPPVGRQKLDRMFRLPEHVRVTVALDSIDALDGLVRAAKHYDRMVGVLIEIDAGMYRVGVSDPRATVYLARAAADSDAIEWRGIMFYPGHVREHVDQQETALQTLSATIRAHLEELNSADLVPEIISGGSTPAAFNSHKVDPLTEIRPGTYIFND